jgi:hypothetical protein
MFLPLLSIRSITLASVNHFLPLLSIRSITPAFVNHFLPLLSKGSITPALVNHCLSSLPNIHSLFVFLFFLSLSSLYRRNVDSGVFELVATTECLLNTSDPQFATQVCIDLPHALSKTMEHTLATNDVTASGNGNDNAPADARLKAFAARHDVELKFCVYDVHTIDDNNNNNATDDGSIAREPSVQASADSLLSFTTVWLSEYVVRRHVTLFRVAPKRCTQNSLQIIVQQFKR